MRKLVIFVTGGLAAGFLYGWLSTRFHWYLPPNWLARVFSADGEDAHDLAYVSLLVDTAGAGLATWLCPRYFQRRSTLDDVPPARAFEILADLPKDVLPDGRRDGPPQKREGL
jgi:hypothetical protein